MIRLVEGDGTYGRHSENAAAKPELAQGFGVKRLAISGSHATGEQTAEAGLAEFSKRPKA